MCTERNFPVFCSSEPYEEGEYDCPCVMCVEEKDASKAMVWKSMGDPASSTSGEGAAVKKRLPRRIRQIPDYYYFLPRKSLPSAVLFYGSWTVAGLGTGMLTEVWIKKKVKEDGGVIWEFGK